MRIIPIIITAACLLSGGCDSSSEVIISAADTTETPVGEQETLRAMFSGATFVAVNQPDSAEDTDNGLRRGSSVVSFTADSVTWTQADLVQVGSYSLTTDTNLIARFPDREVTFSADGGNLVWDSMSHRRGASSLFNSQESLITYLDGSRYDTLEQFDIGETPDGRLALGKWSVRFDGDEIHWAVQDTVTVGTYSYINESTFKADFIGHENIIVILDNYELVINSTIYKEDFSNQFNSQETLLEFLNGSTYKSLELLDVGETSDATIALDYWQVIFEDGMFTWFYQDIAEVGTVAYTDVNTFTAIFHNRENLVTVDGDDIIWDGIRYRKQSGE